MMFYKMVIVLNQSHLGDNFHLEEKIPKVCREILKEI